MNSVLDILLNLHNSAVGSRLRLEGYWFLVVFLAFFTVSFVGSAIISLVLTLTLKVINWFYLWRLK